MFCYGRDHYLSRRNLLFGAAKAGAFLAALRRGDGEERAAGVPTRNTAKVCVFVTMNGAPSHVDTFDPKDGPWNPGDADFQQTGSLILNRTLFPNFTRNAADFLALHSVTSWEAAHDRGQFYLQTSHPANPAFISESPHLGAIVSTEKGGTGPLPPFLALNIGTVLQGAKFLGGAYEPMIAPANAGGLSTLEHNYYGANSQARFEEKFKLLNDLDSALRQNPYSKEMANHAAFYTAAKRLMYDPVIANVFRFSADENLRYGNTNFGRSCLVARNAIRANAGVSFINIHSNGWDTHQNMFDTGYTPNMYTLCSELDTGIGMLAQDLKDSGHFDSTLVVMMGEFGRTPGPLNPRGGRDHHKSAMCIGMMGGGVKGGRAIGATDAIGEQVITPGWKEDRPIFMEDVAATIYSALGIDWTKAITDTPSGRKFEYVPFGAAGSYTSIDEVFG